MRVDQPSRRPPHRTPRHRIPSDHSAESRLPLRRHLVASVNLRAATAVIPSRAHQAFSARTRINHTRARFASLPNVRQTSSRDGALFHSRSKANSAVLMIACVTQLREAQQGFDYGRDKDVLCSANEQNVEDGNHNCQYRSGDCDLPTNHAIVCRAPRQPRRPPFVETGGDGFWHYGGRRGDILC